MSKLAICLYLISVATAPQNVSATAISATSILLKWKQPALFNGILHDYKIRYKLALDSNYSSSIGVGRELNYTIVGLKPYSDYEFKVRLSVILLCHNARLWKIVCMRD